MHLRAAGAVILLSLLALAPAALAGSAADPEIQDANDDVNVDGRCAGQPDPCPSQGTLWPGGDLSYAYVSDTPDALLLTIGLRGAGFTTPSTLETALSIEYGYLFPVTVKGQTYGATAHFPHGGPITPGGVATVATTDATGRELTLTVPKANINAGKGDVASQLFVQVSGLGPNGFTLADRAPNAAFGRDYKIVNGTSAEKVVHGTLRGSQPSVTQAFEKATNATYDYAWTSPFTNLTLGYDVKVQAGAVAVTVATAGNQTLQSGSFERGAAGNATMTGASGGLLITLKFTQFKGSVTLAFGPTPAGAKPSTTPFGATGTATTAPPTNSTSPTSTSTTKSPGPGVLALLGAVGVAVVALRRRRL